MAQFIISNNSFITGYSTVFEVVFLASSNGALITNSNPLPTIVNNNPVGCGSFVTNQSSINAVSVGLVAASRTGVLGTGRLDITIFNYGSANVFLGSTVGVTTSNGLPLIPGASLTLPTTSAVYGIATSGIQTICVVETF